MGLAVDLARFMHLPAFLHLAGDGQDAHGFIAFLLAVVVVLLQKAGEPVLPLLWL